MARRRVGSERPALLVGISVRRLRSDEAALTGRAGTFPARVSPTGTPADPAELDVTVGDDVAGEEVLTTGVADALALAPDGSVKAVIDWKSDVRASHEARVQYRWPLRMYLRLVGAKRTLVVAATTGEAEVA